MMIARIAARAVWFVAAAQATVYADSNAPPVGEPRDMPVEMQLIREETLASVQDINDKRTYFTWPPAAEIARRLRQSAETIQQAAEKRANPRWISTEKETVTEAKRMAEKWIRAILKPCWIPTDINARLTALDADVNGCDEIRVRYEVSGFYIQIMQTTADIAVTIKPVAQAQVQVDTLIDVFLVKPNEVTAATVVRPLPNVPRGLYAVPRDGLTPDSAVNQYWGHLRWWTDGEVLALFAQKYYGGKGIPMDLPKDWF